MKREDLEYLVNCLIWAAADLTENMAKDPARVLDLADPAAIGDAENTIHTLNELIGE